MKFSDECIKYMEKDIWFYSIEDELKKLNAIEHYNKKEVNLINKVYKKLKEKYMFIHLSDVISGYVHAVNDGCIYFKDIIKYIDDIFKFTFFELC